MYKQEKVRKIVRQKCMHMFLLCVYIYTFIAYSKTEKLDTYVDRQIDGQIDIQRNNQIDREKFKNSKTEKLDIHIFRQIQIKIQIDIQVYRQIDREIDRYIEK